VHGEVLRGIMPNAMRAASVSRKSRVGSGASCRRGKKTFLRRADKRFQQVRVRARDASGATGDYLWRVRLLHCFTRDGPVALQHLADEHLGDCTAVACFVACPAYFHAWIPANPTQVWIRGLEAAADELWSFV
jgi:hypothetical protein